MDETLSWKEHVSSLPKKVSSRLALLHCSRKVLPKSACITLYNKMELPLFDYRAVVWDSCVHGRKFYLDKLNRRAACIIEGRAVGSEELSIIFGWPICKRAVTSSNLSLILNVSTDWRLYIYLLSELKYAHQIHAESNQTTRSVGPPLARTTKYQSSFRINDQCECL